MDALTEAIAVTNTRLKELQAVYSSSIDEVAVLAAANAELKQKLTRLQRILLTGKAAKEEEGGPRSRASSATRLGRVMAVLRTPVLPVASESLYSKFLPLHVVSTKLSILGEFWALNLDKNPKDWVVITIERMSRVRVWFLRSTACPQLDRGGGEEDGGGEEGGGCGEGGDGKEGGGGDDEDDNFFFGTALNGTREELDKSCAANKRDGRAEGHPKARRRLEEECSALAGLLRAGLAKLPAPAPAPVVAPHHRPHLTPPLLNVPSNGSGPRWILTTYLTRNASGPQRGESARRYKTHMARRPSNGSNSSFRASNIAGRSRLWRA
ncbi:hypothetical protein FB451DRAFT_1169114 [Mycena latifolia]|nr:hypothetical protein FB451DRAFT_1169114 [Mycena latifolia]